MELNSLTLSIKYVAAENLFTKNVFHIISAMPREQIEGRGKQASMFFLPSDTNDRLHEAYKATWATDLDIISYSLGSICY